MSNNSKDRSKGRESVDSKDNSELWKDAVEKRKLKIAKAEAKRTAQEKTLVAQNVGDKHSEILDENRQIREGLKKITSSDNHDPSGGLFKINPTSTRKRVHNDDSRDEDQLSNISNDQNMALLAHTFRQGDIEAILTKNFSIADLETMQQRLEYTKSSNEFRNGLFLGEAKTMMQTLLGEDADRIHEINHEQFFETLKGKVRTRLNGTNIKSLPELKTKIRKLRIPEDLTNYTQITEWAFNLESTLKGYPQEVITLLDSNYEGGKTHFMHIMMGMYPKERDNVHENLRAGWSNNMTRQHFSRYVVDYSLKAQQRAQQVISDGFLANKPISKRADIEELPNTSSSSGTTLDGLKGREKRKAFWKSKQKQQQQLSSLNSLNQTSRTKQNGNNNSGIPKSRFERHTGCGLKHDPNQPCMYKDHPSYNTEDVPFVQSTKGKMYIQATGRNNLTNRVWDDPSNKKLKSEGVSTIFPITPKLECKNNSHITTPYFKIEIGEEVVYPRVLIDTGCFSRNYISNEFLKLINKENSIHVHINSVFNVCSCLGKCVQCDSYVVLNLKYIQKETITFYLKLYIIPSTIDIIIGQPDYIKLDLGKICKPFIKVMHKQFQQEELDTLVYQTGIQILIPKEDILNIEKDTDVGEDKITPWKNFLEQPQDGENNLPLKSQIEGDESLQLQTMQLIQKYKHVFSRSLPSEPAKVTPMHLKVDQEKWKHRRNEIRPRPLSVERERQCRLQIAELMNIKVITPASVAYCSAVHMVPKPNSKELRFTVDFRNLNEATESDRLHLPNIKNMLQVLGETKPKYFCKLDLTKGYYQIPLAEDSREWTAFTSHAGTYQWTRVPMGLKGAAGWFQKVLTTECLKELMHSGKILLYIDDLIISGTNFKEYLENLEKVLKRLGEFGFVVHPGKCQFNVEEIEYVGHTLNSSGIKFSKEKTKKLIEQLHRKVINHL